MFERKIMGNNKRDINLCFKVISGSINIVNTNIEMNIKPVHSKDIRIGTI
jgi:hypothetical protein